MKKPKVPRPRRFVLQKFTELAMAMAVRGDSRSVGIFIDEGDTLAKSRGMSSFGFLNKLTDGALVTYDRADDELVITNPRVTVDIMTQFAPFEAFRQKHGGLSRGTGFWARYLVSRPWSTQGYRNVLPYEPAWAHLPKVHARCEELMQAYIAKVAEGPVERELLEFTDDAKARWYQAAANIEQDLRPGGYLADIPDFGAKMLEHASRLAALFHFFAGESGKITTHTLECAINVVAWHAGEFKRLFSPECAVPEHVRDAEVLRRYLRERVWRGPGSQSLIAKNQLLKFGPNSLRKSQRLNPALATLVASGAIWIGILQKTGQKFVNLNDGWFLAP